MSEQYKLAVQAYAAALQLNPMSIASRLFSAECYIKCALFDKAQVEFIAAKEISKSMQIDQEWLDLLANIEGLINK